MKAYYTEEESGKGLSSSVGRLRIEATNIPEFQELINQANKEARQLKRTIERLQAFEINIDFSIGKIGEEVNK